MEMILCLHRDFATLSLLIFQHVIQLQGPSWGLNFYCICCLYSFDLCLCQLSIAFVTFELYFTTFTCSGTLAVTWMLTCWRSWSYATVCILKKWEYRMPDYSLHITNGQLSFVLQCYEHVVFHICALYRLKCHIFYQPCLLVTSSSSDIW